MLRRTCSVAKAVFLSALAVPLLRPINDEIRAVAAFSVALPAIDAVPDAIAYPATLLAAFRAGAALSVLNHPRMPRVDVPAGSAVLRLPSGARVRLFYPAAEAGDGSATTMAPYCTDGRQTSDGMAARVGFRQAGLSFLLGHLADACSGCIQDAPLRRADDTAISSENTTNVSLPLLIYSHGYGGNMDMATYFFRTMASKGMILAAVEHTDGTASSTVLEDGRERRFNEYLMTGRQQLVRRASELLEAADFLPRELQRRFDDTNSTRVVGTITLGGHSYGAPSAIMAANGAAAGAGVRGLLLHDPALGMGYGMLPPNGARSRIPSVTYVSDVYRRAGVRYGDATLHVRGGFHGNFVDAPLWAPAAIMRPLSLAIPAAGPADPWAVHEQLADSAAAFLESGDPRHERVSAGDLLEPCES